jgi:hypothetical protein
MSESIYYVYIYIMSGIKEGIPSSIGRPSYLLRYMKRRTTQPPTPAYCPDNMLVNGALVGPLSDFTIPGWGNPLRTSGAPADISMVDKDGRTNVLRIQGKAGYGGNGFTQSIPLEEGETYRVKFDAWAAEDNSVGVFVESSGYEYWAKFLDHPGQWYTYSYTIPSRYPPIFSGRPYALRLGSYRAYEIVYFDKVCLTKL